MRRTVIAVLLSLAFLGLSERGQAQTNYQRLRSFGFSESLGASPRTAPIEASDGRVYGTTFFGGGDLDTDGGGIFAVNKDSSGYRLLYRFSGNHDDARNLPAPIIEATDGLLYGVTAFGGSNDFGTVFKLNKDGNGFTVLHNFTGTNGDGEYPQGPITEAHDGALYGTTSGGGDGGGGGVFKINKDGTGYRIIHAFIRGSTNADGPAGHILEGSDGALYGTSFSGGAQRSGTVFRLSTEGTVLEVLHSFSGTDGGQPLDIIEGSDGGLYGTTQEGGRNENGVIFKIHKDGSGFTVMHNFADTLDDAAALYAGVVEGSDGALYGTSYEGGSTDMGTIFRISKDGTDYGILRSFDDNLGDGGCPYAGLTKGSDGTLYGATNDGGAADAGTLFRITNDGAHYTVLHNFALVRGGDGSSPRGDLLEASDGALYGTTALGGSAQRGTVFKMTKAGGGYTVLVNFTGLGDGQTPQARLLEGSDGQLYGTTLKDGINNGGVVFTVKKDGTGFSTLHHFTGYSPAVWNPFAALIEGSDGALYGTATFDAVTYQAGTVYRLTKDGSQYSVIHRFTGADGDGAWPQAGLIRGTDGAFYGTTFNGGFNNNGTVFKLNENGNAYLVLHRFRSDTIDDGRSPAAGLMQGSDGALYGTTALGGSDDAGTVFKLACDGAGYALLHSFSAAANHPQLPAGSLVEAGDGSLCGVTSRGGASNAGTAFKLNKDGSGFAVLRNFSESGGDGAKPIAALMRASDGALYGTASEGGDFSSGILFRLFSGLPQITINKIQIGGAGAFLNFSGGAAGQNYQIEASTTLGARASWDILGSTTAAIDGQFQFLDPVASNNPMRFYRTAIR